jgi:hypothetical protein
VSDFDLDFDDITVMITSIWFWFWVLVWTLSAILYYYTSTSSVGIYFCFLYLPLIYLALSTSHSIVFCLSPFVYTITTLSWSSPFVYIITTFNIYIVFPHYFVHGATSMLYHVGRGIQFISQYIYTLYAFLYCSLYYTIQQDYFHLTQPLPSSFLPPPYIPATASIPKYSSFQPA